MLRTTSAPMFDLHSSKVIERYLPLVVNGEFRRHSDVSATEYATPLRDDDQEVTIVGRGDDFVERELKVLKFLVDGGEGLPNSAFIVVGIVDDFPMS